MYISYANTFFSGRELKEAAKAYLECLPQDTGGLLSQGTSGCAIASAMLAHSRRSLTHVSLRKEGETSHRSTFAGIVNSEIPYTIVDDFIATGATITRLLEWAQARKLSVNAILIGEIYQSADKELSAIKCKVIEVAP